MNSANDRADLIVSKGISDTPCGSPIPPKLRSFGDYELLALIGQGGMGKVYRARQLSLDRTVALKMISSGMFASEAEVKRFLNEARAAAEVNHPNIVKIHEVGHHEGEYYFTMEYVDGVSLDGALPELRRDLRKAVRTMVKVVRAVSSVHQVPILHRDLKPGNILLDRTGEPYVADFGLAKRMVGPDSMSFAKGVLGSPAYMAPEQTPGHWKPLTTKVDIYSLGAILYQILTGQPPFKAHSVSELLRQVEEDEPRPPSAVRSEVDHELETICLKCLEKDPEKRYFSAEALANDLVRWLKGEPIEAVSPTPFYRFKKFAARHQVTLATVSLVASVLIASTVHVWMSNARLTKKGDELRRKHAHAEAEQRLAEFAQHKARSAAAAAVAVIDDYKRNAEGANAAISGLRRSLMAGFMGLDLRRGVPHLNHGGEQPVTTVALDLRHALDSYFESASDQSHAEVCASLAAFLAKEGHWDAAVEELERALRLWSDPKRDGAVEVVPHLLGLANSYWTNRLDPTDPEAFLDLIALAKTYLKANRPDDAREWTDRVWTLYEGDEFRTAIQQAAADSGESADLSSFRATLDDAKGLVGDWKVQGSDGYAEALLARIQKIEGSLPSPPESPGSLRFVEPADKPDIAAPQPPRNLRVAF